MPVAFLIFALITASLDLAGGKLPENAYFNIDRKLGDL